MLPNQIVRMLNLFDACGYNTGSSKLSDHPRIIFFKFLQFCLFFLFIFLMLSHSLSSYFYEPRPIEYFNQMIQYYVCLGTYFIIIYDALSQQQKHKHFWKVVQVIDEKFGRQNGFSCRSISFKLIEHFAITFLAIIIYCVISSYKSTHLLFHLLVKLCHLRVFYYIFCVNIIYFQLKNLHDELKTINTLDFTSQIHQIKLNRDYYHCVHDMIASLNEVFDWSGVTTVSFCFFFWLADLNWCYSHLGSLSTSQLVGMLVL